MTNLLPGNYPFADQILPLDEMVMREAPRDLEALSIENAYKQGIAIIRDEPVEITCTAEGFPDATFLVYWPTGAGHIHILAPKASVLGRA